MSYTKIQFWKQITTQRLRRRVAVCCIELYKDTILKANHNALKTLKNSTSAVLSYTKIQFWKQITTSMYKYNNNICCIELYKDTILKANHNSHVPRAWHHKAVLSYTKIQFWKQITTWSENGGFITMLYWAIQRYNFESKSQPILVTELGMTSCIELYKDTILKANHNIFCNINPSNCAVLSYTKIQFWKQITTALGKLFISMVLYWAIQRYNFESKSQQ